MRGGCSWRSTSLLPGDGPRHDLRGHIRLDLVFPGCFADLDRHLDKLLDEDHCALARPVRIELLLGVSRRQLPQFRRLISAIPLYDPMSQTWRLIEDWVDKARSKGQKFGFADLLIAAVAAENQGEIWSLDHDFRRMEKLGFVGCPALREN